MTPPLGREPLAPCEALVVFSGSAMAVWLRVLKAGFRHCFLIVRSAGIWVLYDPLATGTELAVLGPHDADDLVDFFEGHGLMVVRTRTRRLTHTPIPWRPFTCVEAVKRALGIRAGGIWTPWQLYRYVIKSLLQEKRLDTHIAA